MSRPNNFAADLRSLQLALDDLEEARDEMPAGAHIRALFEIAIVRAEEQIDTLLRLRALLEEQSTACLAAA